MEGPGEFSVWDAVTDHGKDQFWLPRELLPTHTVIWIPVPKPPWLRPRRLPPSAWLPRREVRSRSPRRFACIFIQIGTNLSIPKNSFRPKRSFGSASRSLYRKTGLCIASSYLACLRISSGYYTSLLLRLIDKPKNGVSEPVARFAGRERLLPGRISTTRKSHRDC